MGSHAASRSIITGQCYNWISTLSEAPPRGQFLRHGWPFGLVVLCVVLLSAAGDSARQALRYERAAIAAGEYWRLLTGHVVHGNWQHALLNLAGLWLLASLFRRTYSALQWTAIVAVSLLAIDAGFWWLEPRLEWYVGLSGVLHGILAAGAVAWWRVESRPFALALTLIVIGKLIWEQWQGALPLSGDLPVIVDAHLYGAIGGGVVAAILQLMHKRCAGRASVSPAP